MEIKAILFDVDGTLFDFSKAEQTAFTKTLSYFGIIDKNGKLAKNYAQCNDRMWEKFEQGQISAKKLRIERFRLFLEQSRLPGKAAEFSKKYISELSRCRYLLPGAKQILQQLFGKFEINLITNGLQDVQRSRIEKSELANYYSQLFISEEIGFPKPDRRIFDFVFKKILHKNKKQVLIVGDNLFSDIKGGIDYGIRTCWFNPLNAANSSNIVPEFEIQDLTELKKILGVEDENN